MKKRINFTSVSVLLAAFLSSCTTTEEQDYERKVFKHKARMLDLEYKKECIELNSDIELEQTLRWLDSVNMENHCQ